MNKVIIINLSGTAFQLEEDGYEALRAYLDGAARRLEGNPDKDEIIADIEQAIADKCRAVLGAYKNVVVTHEIEQIIEEMGPVQDAAAEGEERPAGGGGAASANTSSGAAGPGAAAAESGAPPRVRRLYKIHDGAMFAGVCNGLAAFFGIDPTIVRLVFVLLHPPLGLRRPGVPDPHGHPALARDRRPRRPRPMARRPPRRNSSGAPARATTRA